MRFSNIQEHHGLIPVLALEVEWYLKPAQPVLEPEPYVEKFLEKLHTRASEKNLNLHSVSAERGYLQAEAALLPTHNIRQLIAQYGQLCAIVREVADEVEAKADFSAKPYANDYGSGIHVHVHLEDENRTMLFFKDSEHLSDALRYSMGGLLQTLEENLPVFVPSPESWQRIVPGYHAPVNVSWGFNNRTTAIRLPDSIGEYQGAETIAAIPPSHFKRIEHRVAGSDADIEKVIEAVLRGIDKGLSDKIEPPSPIFGNASDAQYDLKPLRKDN